MSLTTIKLNFQNNTFIINALVTIIFIHFRQGIDIIEELSTLQYNGISKLTSFTTKNTIIDAIEEKE